MIRLDSLTCKYENRTVLEDVSLHVKQHLSVLGANGSGKSTFAKALCKLIDYEGIISLDNIDIKNLSSLELAKSITYIPAKLEVYDPYISVYEFVLLGRFAYKKSFFEYSQGDKQCVDEKLKLLNIEHLQEYHVADLSSGEQQLSLIAQALTQESKIIIFDEPTANLDPYNSKIIANHIKRLKESHQVILITHDLHLSKYIDNPILFISQKKTHYYDDRASFFDEAVLQEHYGVTFDALAVQYE
ncbi:MAG: ABC transporter ATP-binding protein [Campylobacterota bacterium]|nr:ABC transporter ATP-binding protein [Campylobacterota bacterium]